MNRAWNILCWNVRGLNTADKWPSIRSKIDESNCEIICFQETKKEQFDPSFIRNIAPKKFDKFLYSPSVGASGGILVAWNGSLFDGSIIEIKPFAVAISFSSKMEPCIWKLVNVYGPCTEPARSHFISWLKNLDIEENANWLILGDFNFYRSLENRNKNGGNLQDTLVFNDMIDYLGLVELPLKGRGFTWSNMQTDPLLEQLDWFFTSENWTADFPDTMVTPLARPTSDHVPCKVTVGTKIPRSNLFRFENFWTAHSSFFSTVQQSWEKPTACQNNSVAILSAKFKRLRYDLKKWSQGLSNMKLLINNCNNVILYMDTLEQFRPLFNLEWNLRTIVKKQLNSLLLQQCQYWKQRNTVNRIKFGDECTKYFHSMATTSYRRNLIAQIQDDYGISLVLHEEKANHFWCSFKNRMGISEEVHMEFNLSNLMPVLPNSSIDSLVMPFTKAEIDRIIKIMPVDKAPGPDGFNGLFIKKCWNIIKEDVYRLFEDFYEERVNLGPINSSYIVLVPKVECPVTANDFRPISLLNCCVKMITKLLAERLQSIVLKYIHKNQYGFIKTRTIQDCLGWSFEYIHQCHQSKREIVIVKLDFAKAFDTIEHSAILEVLRVMGFPIKWRNWIKAILGSGTAAVLLNGVPGKTFNCKRGVRQGDPLSPLLFVIASEILQYIINGLKEKDILKLPIPQPTEDFPVVQYADDTLLIMQADARQLFCLKAILNTFAISTGLKVNFGKSQILPINVDAEKMKVLAGTLGCQVGSFPFTYLGLPLGTVKPKLEDFAPLLDKVQRKLSASSTLLSYSGRMEYINTVITPTVTYAMCTFKLHKGVINDIDRIRKQCLWRGNSEKKRGGNLVAWPLVQRPKEKGGLGIKNLQLQNDALLMKQLHKFYDKVDIPWVQQLWYKYYDGKVPHAQRELGSFWWKDIFRLKNLYCIITSCQIGDGSSTLFWKDNWTGESLEEVFPDIAGCASNPNISVREVAEATSLEELFTIPISQAAAHDLEELRDLVQSFSLSDGIDKRVFCWGNSKYAASKLYKLAFLTVSVPSSFALIWKSKVTARIKFFAWLILLDRLNTRSMLVRRHFNVQPNSNCVLCTSGEEETFDHLFFGCCFARSCWDKLGLIWTNDEDIHRRIMRTRQLANNPCFTEIFLIAAWEIWKVRNRKIFDGVPATFARWLRNFKAEVALQSIRVRDDCKSLVLLWLESL